MPGRGGKAQKPKFRHFKAKQQKKRYIRSKDPLMAVFMWGVQHSINELNSGVEPSLLLPEDFKAYSKLRVENQYYNKENLPGHFKFKEYCPRVFHDLRKRFGIDDIEYMSSLINQPPRPIDSPGRSNAKFYVSYDSRLILKSITTEEVALLHQILQLYHAHVVTTEAITLLPQYLGTYRLTVNNAETYWLVMRNIFSSTVKIHLKYDLKGSTVDRAASDKEKAKRNPTLKDNDFVVSGEKIVIGEEAKREFVRTLESDVTLLQKLNLMDYSLLVGIHDCTVPPDLEDDAEEEEEDDMEDCEGYLSNDDIVETPQTPTSPATGDEMCSSGELLDSPSSPETGKPPLLEPLPEVSPTAEGATALESPRLAEKNAPTEFVISEPAVVKGEKAVEVAVIEGKAPVIDKAVDVFAIPGSKGAKPQVYFMGLIDVLTNYGARKRAAHAAKTMKHGAGAEISTVRPEQYARRFLDFLAKALE